MNILTPVRSIMITDLYTVHPKDTLYKAKELIDTHAIHHLPVVEFKKIVGIISKTDLLYFVKGAKKLSEQDELRNKMWLSHCQVKDMMSTQLATLNPEDTIRTAIEVFQKNLFHALPVVENNDLVGMITTYDLLTFFAQEKIQLGDYKTAV